MITKTYRAASLSEAIHLIKKEMGSNATIVSTRTHPARKTLFRFIPAEIEVLASIDEKYLTSQQLDIIGVAVGEGGARKGGMFTGLPTLASQILERQKGGVVVTKSPDTASKTAADPLDEKIAMEHRAMREKIRKLEEENAQLKKELALLSQTKDEFLMFGKALKPARLAPEPKPSETAPVVFAGDRQDIRDYLSEQGLAEEILSAWQKRMENLPAMASRNELLDDSIEYFMDLFPAPLPELPRLLAFLGPQKGGKTSALMKLAHVLKAEGRKVAIFTLDVTDPQAVGDLSDFAAREDIPFVPIRQNKMFDRLRKEYYDCDHLLVDTYSVATGDRSGLKRLASRLEGMGTSNIAVFSASDAKMAETLKDYRDFPLNALVFTRIDCVARPGMIYNAMVELAKPVAFFGIGKDVPDDFEPATPERLVSLLFNLEQEVRAAHAHEENAVAETSDSGKGSVN